MLHSIFISKSRRVRQIPAALRLLLNELLINSIDADTMENRNTPTNPAPCVLEGYANMLVDGYDGTIQQHRVVDGHELFKEGYRLWQLYPELRNVDSKHVDIDYQLVIGYLMANELEISKRSPTTRDTTRPLTEQRLLTELRNALKEERTLSPNQRKFMADLTSVEHAEYRKVLVDIVQSVQLSAIYHKVER